MNTDARILRAIETIEARCDFLRMQLGFETRSDAVKRSAPKATHACPSCNLAFHSEPDLRVHVDMEHTAA